VLTIFMIDFAEDSYSCCRDVAKPFDLEFRNRWGSIFISIVSLGHVIFRFRRAGDFSHDSGPATSVARLTSRNGTTVPWR